MYNNFNIESIFKNRNSSSLMRDALQCFLVFLLFLSLGSRLRRVQGKNKILFHTIAII